ncbi:hypothetical protein [Neolewinella persica]|uniref:hypothetical protein n=1 Tax=Neolewinella persica TaxID=70998 RepID=UPI0003827EF9|nr:hypothetical protein [Neolewinella persica]
MSSLASLLATATRLPGFDIWRGLAPRRFLIEVVLADFIKATEVLPADADNGIFAALTTSPLGFPEVLPQGFAVIAHTNEYFITIMTPEGTTAEQLREVLALELMPNFFDCPDEQCNTNFEQRLTEWLEAEIYGGDDQSHATSREIKEDLDFVYGNGRTPPQYHGWRQDMDGSDLVGEPEVSDQDIQWVEDIAKQYQ